MVLEDRTEDAKTWRYRSSSGFLGEGESLVGVIEADKRAVLATGLSSDEIAGMLAQVVVSVREQNERSRSMPKRVVEHMGQRLEVECCAYMSPQYSLFWNEALPDSEANIKWQTEYRIANLRLPGFCLLVGGDDRAGSLSYIKALGFYQGGFPHNGYRLDPRMIAAVLTGRVTDEAVALLSRILEAELERLRRQLDEVRLGVAADDPYCVSLSKKIDEAIQSNAQTIQIWRSNIDINGK